MDKRTVLIGLAVLSTAVVLGTRKGYAGDWTGWQIVPGTGTPDGGRVEYRVQWNEREQVDGNTKLYFQLKNQFPARATFRCDIILGRANGTERKEHTSETLDPGQQSSDHGNWAYGASFKAITCLVNGTATASSSSADGGARAANSTESSRADAGSRGRLSIATQTPLRFRSASTSDGSIRESRDVAIRNDGQASLTIASVILAGSDPTHFQLVERVSSKTLAPGQAASVTVSYAPRAKGSHAAIITFTTDTNDRQSIGLFGLSQ